MIELSNKLEQKLENLEKEKNKRIRTKNRDCKKSKKFY